MYAGDPLAQNAFLEIVDLVVHFYLSMTSSKINQSASSKKKQRE
jgi:hypothetical protein